MGTDWCGQAVAERNGAEQMGRDRFGVSWRSRIDRAWIGMERPGKAVMVGIDETWTDEVRSGGHGMGRMSRERFGMAGQSGKGVEWTGKTLVRHGGQGRE